MLESESTRTHWHQSNTWPLKKKWRLRVQAQAQAASAAMPARVMVGHFAVILGPGRVMMTWTPSRRLVTASLGMSTSSMIESDSDAAMRACLCQLLVVALDKVVANLKFIV
jgi:hypothetical protein